ncbi:fungal-specific transcription factor domain-containing protein [Schizophyllum commune]
MEPSPTVPGPIDSKAGKVPVVRGARACNTCRSAKMKCVGAEEEGGKCQRCRRANVECVFEKHRRGRKPGSKLSEASKMLRRLEKGLNSAKLKSHSQEGLAGGSEGRSPSHQGDSSFGTHFPGNQLPPLSHLYESGGHMPDEDDADTSKPNIFPRNLVENSNKRTFFSTILNPADQSAPSHAGSPASQPEAFPPSPPRLPPLGPDALRDPVASGILDEKTASDFFDMFYLRLNPFINLFDPELHTVNYVRSRCPFLFTTMLMAGCKFFASEKYKEVQKLAHEFAVKAFAEGWKRVEVIQAFACLTYWKEPDDTRTWTYIGYACRMAVELGLNRYIRHRPPHESDMQLLERRNRERTYLVLFVHDRSLSTQTGRHYMLPDDEFIRNSTTWHDEGAGPLRPSDVIVSAFVQLRRLASETTEMLYNNKGGGSHGAHADVNYDMVLRGCNSKLTQWSEHWQHEMQRANGAPFHFSFLNFFRLYVRLFLNSFGLQESMMPGSHVAPSLQTLSACCTSGLDSLKIVSHDFAATKMLRYGQDSITVMTAYAAVFLLKLLRNPNTMAQLQEGTAQEIHALISKTADAFADASGSSSASEGTEYHARFLRSLLQADMMRARQAERDRYDHSPPIDPRFQAGPPSAPPMSDAMYAPQPQAAQSPDAYGRYATSVLPTLQDAQYMGEVRGMPMDDPSRYAMSSFTTYPQHASEMDRQYWRQMFMDIGFGDTGFNVTTDAPSFMEQPPQQQQPQQHQAQHLQSLSMPPPMSYSPHGHTAHAHHRQSLPQHLQPHPMMSHPGPSYHLSASPYGR